MKYVGLDLAGSPMRPTGFCVIDDRGIVRCKILRSDEDILRAVRHTGSRHVAIDAPLALPKGRHCLEEHCRGKTHFRECDRVLARMRIKFFPITIGPMRQLTARGIRVMKRLQRQGLQVVETFPGAAQDLLGMPRKQHDLSGLQEALIQNGCKGDLTERPLTGDELDAVNCALVARDFANNRYVAIGDPSEILMILPRFGTRRDEH